MELGVPCPGRRRPRASTATVCIYSMYSVTEGEDVNGTAKFCIPWAVSLEQFANCSSLSPRAFKGQLQTYLFGRGQ